MFVSLKSAAKDFGQQAIGQQVVVDRPPVDRLHFPAGYFSACYLNWPNSNHAFGLFAGWRSSGDKVPNVKIRSQLAACFCRRPLI
jgi:hypothetical protein